jgi:hypothetical protein
MEQGYVSRNAKQSRDIRHANEKLLALERTLQTMVEQFEKERAFMRQQWSKALENMTREVESHKRLAEVRVPARYTQLGPTMPMPYMYIPIMVAASMWLPPWWLPPSLMSTTCDSSSGYP